MVSAIMEGTLSPAEQSKILCYYFNESSEKQIINIKKEPESTEVVLLPKQGIFFEAMPDTWIKIYRSFFSGIEIVDAIHCKAIQASEQLHSPQKKQAIAHFS